MAGLDIELGAIPVEGALPEALESLLYEAEAAFGLDSACFIRIQLTARSTF